MTRERPLAHPRHLFGIGLGLLGWMSFLLLSASPSVAETVAGAGPVPALRRAFSVVSGVVPLPFAELIVLGVLLRQVTGAWGGLARVVRKEEGAGRVLARGGVRLGSDVGILLFLFYLLWGFQYARPGLEAHLGIEPAGEVSASELRALAERSVEAANLLYREIHGTTDAGEPTPAASLRELAPALEQGWARVREDYGLPERVERGHGAPKAFLSTPLVKRLGVAGMYFPYTGEALVLRDLPGVAAGKDLAHEMAHQRGFASESDANVLGFLVARASPDLLVRYSAQAFLQRQLVSALQRVSPSAAREVARGRDPGVARDLRDLQEYWRPSQGAAGAAAARVNDAMLRSHGVREGVASYQGSVWVLVSLARERGPDALF